MTITSIQGSRLIVSSIWRFKPRRSSSKGWCRRQDHLGPNGLRQRPGNVPGFDRESGQPYIHGLTQVEYDYKGCAAT